jgi:DNA-binding transcriptional MerR regulator
VNLSPKQAAEQLDVSVQTLRRWSGEFAASLSSAATPPAGKRRSYTPADLVMLAHAQELIAAGRSVSEVAGILQTIEAPPEDVAETLPATVDQFTGFERLIDQVSALADQKSEIERQASEIDDLRRRLDAIEGRERRTLWDRLRGR